LRVLLVEDHEDTAASTALLLHQQGYKVDIAPDGPSALEKARAEPPDVVLLDIGLPKLDGYAVADELNRLPKPPSIIAITGHGAHADYRRSAEKGILFHFLKPTEPDLLLQVLKTFGDRRDPSGQRSNVLPPRPPAFESSESPGT
jgi:CheY-like chemotaxis protein